MPLLMSLISFLPRLCDFTSRRMIHAKLEGLPLACQSSRLHLLEMEGCCEMERGRGSTSEAIFSRMAAIEEAVDGLSFFRLKTLRTQLRLCCASLLAGKRRAALATLRRLCKGCFPPNGMMSVEDLVWLAERYDFGFKEEMLGLILEACKDR